MTDPLSITLTPQRLETLLAAARRGLHYRRRDDLRHGFEAKVQSRKRYGPLWANRTESARWLLEHDFITVEHLNTFGNMLPTMGGTNWLLENGYTERGEKQNAKRPQSLPGLSEHHQAR